MYGKTNAYMKSPSAEWRSYRRHTTTDGFTLNVHTEKKKNSISLMKSSIRISIDLVGPSSRDSGLSR